MSKFVSMLAIAALAGSASAAGQFQVTEIFGGLPGEDGTADWFELTNTGDMPLSTDGLLYDDESSNVLDAGALDVVTVAAGESIVVVIGSPSDASNFADVWGTGFTVVSTNFGGGGLSQNGDTVNILLANGTVVLSQSFGSISDFGFATADTLSGTPVASLLGVNGAYESNEFFNDNIGEAPDFLVSLVGSPGAVPTPGAVALLGCAGVASIRRRR